MRIQEFYRRYWRVKIQQVSREANIATHTLVRLMMGFPYGSHVFQDLPLRIADQIKNDGQNLFYGSLVPL